VFGVSAAVYGQQDFHGCSRVSVGHTRYFNCNEASVFVLAQ
jgi:hypothetical protein